MGPKRWLACMYCTDTHFSPYLLYPNSIPLHVLIFPSLTRFNSIPILSPPLIRQQCHCHHVSLQCVITSADRFHPYLFVSWSIPNPSRTLSPNFPRLPHQPAVRLEADLHLGTPSYHSLVRILAPSFFVISSRSGLSLYLSGVYLIFAPASHGALVSLAYRPTSSVCL